jgi:TetR/AcrR family transcriptional regulator, cholesterol catabolism regulator
MGVIRMRPAAPRPTEPPRLQEVLDVAARLFYEKGYRSTSLADIGEVLGMNKASLYYYVRSKEDLARQLILRAAKRLRDVSRNPELDNLPADAALEVLVREHCALVLEHPSEMGLLIQQRRFVEPRALGEITERERLYVANLRSVIARGIQEACFRDVDAGVTTQLILDTVNGLLRWYRPGGRLTREQAIDEIWCYVRGGLCQAIPRPRSKR